MRSLVTDLFKRDVINCIGIEIGWWLTSNRLVQRTRKIMTPLSYHSSNLSLMALETTRFLVQILISKINIKLNAHGFDKINSYFLNRKQRAQVNETFNFVKWNIILSSTRVTFIVFVVQKSFMRHVLFPWRLPLCKLCRWRYTI